MGKNRPNYHKEYYQKHREKFLAKAKLKRQTPEHKQVRRAWAEKNREKIKQQSKEYFQKNKKRINKYRNERRKEHRMAVLRRLGNMCIRCGLSDVRPLQIDHIHGNGSVERKKRGGSIYTYILRLSDEELKNNYQVLCANCNILKMHEREEYSWRNSKCS